MIFFAPMIFINSCVTVSSITSRLFIIQLETNRKSCHGCIW